MSSRDVQTRFHEEWIGLVQPIEGLVFSIPVLADAQIAPEPNRGITAEFKEFLKDDDTPEVVDLKALFQRFFGYSGSGMIVSRAELPEALSFYAEEGGQEIKPSFAISKILSGSNDDDLFGDFGKADTASDAQTTPPTDEATSPYAVIVWDIRDDLSSDCGLVNLDKSEAETGTWKYPPTAKFERLLRHVKIPVGLLCNGGELRLVYAPVGESSSHLTFRFNDMTEAAGRPILLACELLLSANRMYNAASEYTLEGLLKESRRRQVDVTKDLAAQVFEAVEILLKGFEQAAQKSSAGGQIDWLRMALEEDDDHLYQGILSVVLRLVFLLYSEDQGLLPIGHRFYARHLSVQGLYDDLMDDVGMHPESMNHRYGAYGRLLSLFRAIYLGVKHGDLQLPPRRGRLFDPSSFPFLEGGLPGSTAAITSPDARAAVNPPPIDDGTVYEALKRLIVFEGQRLSYKALNVEQIGSIYESLMGYHVLRAGSTAVRLGKNMVWVEYENLVGMSDTDRKKFLKEACRLSTAQQAKIAKALKEATDEQSLMSVLIEMVPGKKAKRERHRAAMGRLVLQPGDERRRSGSHYTPRSLTEKIVRRTLEPILKCLGDKPTEDQILSLKICDPAMGSGAFLVETCRHLADHLIAAWTRDGRLAEMAAQYDDPHLHARRLVAQRCLYGVDKNPMAVELAKLSLWLVTMSATLPFTFVDHTLRHGDSLVGLDLEQVQSFHWKPTKQIPTFKQIVEDALNQAIEHRQEIAQLAEKEDTRSQEEKRRLLDHADHATEKIRMIADVCVGAFFSEEKKKAREEERNRRLALCEAYLAGDLSLESQLREYADEIHRQHAPFHWWLEFPEVFYEERPDPLVEGAKNGAAYMEAFVGNPPFAGKNNITNSNGPRYLEWLTTTYDGAHGNSDLSAYFFRQAARLLGEHGTLGLIATNTIGQGDTRTTGLKKLLENNWLIYDATNSMPWPGVAAVAVSVVHASSGECTRWATSFLDGKNVKVINSRLRPSPERPDAKVLQSNSGSAYVGSFVLGAGFTLSPEEHSELISKDAKNAERLFPFLGGQEVNTNPDQKYERYVINFEQMTLAEAENWPHLIQIVRERVKPERDKLKDNADGRRRKQRWWEFGRYTPSLFASIAPLSKCLVTACGATKHLMFSFQPSNRVFSHALFVFPLESFSSFAVLQSRIHEPWARLLSSSLEDRLRYTASDCFDTFPFPETNPGAEIISLREAGRGLYEQRATYMKETQQGLTKTYNALKDATNSDKPIIELRRLHVELDSAVLKAYGWDDIEVPPYCPMDKSDEEAIQAFEDAVIDRLYLLNAERAREEERLGLGNRGKKKAAAKKPAKKKSKKADTASLSLDFKDGKS